MLALNNLTLIDGPNVETIWNADEKRIGRELERAGLPAEFMLEELRKLPEGTTTVKLDVPTVKSHLRSIGVRMPDELEPRREHDQRRANAIHEAVNRKVAAGQPIPVVWITEYNELVNHIHVPTVFDTAKDEDTETEISDGFGDVEIVHLLYGTVGVLCGNEDDGLTTVLLPERVTCFQCRTAIKDMNL